jgi:hypothetical protein
MKVNNQSIFIIASLAVFSLFFILIPYWIHNENGSKSVSPQELIDIKCTIKNIRKTSTGGKHSKPIIYIEFFEYPSVFRLANSSYRAINSDLVLETLNKNTEVTIKTKPKEIKRSETNSLLNLLFRWRKQPLIYSIRTEKMSLLTIEQYNKAEEDLNNSNIKWGIILVLLIAIRLIWVSKK